MAQWAVPGGSLGDITPQPGDNQSTPGFFGQLGQAFGRARAIGGGPASIFGMFSPAFAQGYATGLGNVNYLGKFAPQGQAAQAASAPAGTPAAPGSMQWRNSNAEAANGGGNSNRW